MTKLAHSDILETIKMVDDQHLDVRTITMGISLLDCFSDDIDTVAVGFMIKLPAKLPIWCKLVRILSWNLVFRLSTNVFL